MTYEEILKQPFDVKFIDITGWLLPKEKHPDEKENFEGFYKRMQDEHRPNVLFKNFRVYMETCDCGAEYGCHHPAYPSNITLRESDPGKFEVIFEDDHGFSMSYKHQYITLNKPETTMQDFLDALNLLKVPYELVIKPTTNRDSYASDVWNRACEAQKIICAEKAFTTSECDIWNCKGERVDKDSILAAPVPEFKP